MMKATLDVSSLRFPHGFLWEAATGRCEGIIRGQRRNIARLGYRRGDGGGGPCPLE
jgi:hypothetical protein